MGETVGYFGFGSLVNRATLRTSFINTIPATLKGWRRHWQGRQSVGYSNVALLSIHRAEDVAIHGMLVVDAAENLPLVDEREVGYDRVSIEIENLNLNGDQTVLSDVPDRLYVYVGKPPADPSANSPLLQSYTDAVMQGFHDEYGFEGLEHFVKTTAGFERGIVRDRHDPQYPRAIYLPQDLANRFDDLLMASGVQFGD